MGCCDDPDGADDLCARLVLLLLGILNIQSIVYLINIY